MALRPGKVIFLLALLSIIICGCATPPPRVFATNGYEIRLHETPSGEVRSFEQKLRAHDARLRAVYGLELPHGQVWVEPDAFKEEPIGGTYDWWQDRIVLADRDTSYLDHELVHRYNHFAWGDLPRWLDEGLAYALARGSFDVLDAPGKRHPDFEAIAEVRDARARARPGGFPTMAQVFDDPYANGHLNVRIATVVVDRLLRDRAGESSMHAVLAAVVRAAREMSPDAAQAVLERAAFQDFPRADELRALLSDETAPDELIDALVPALDLEQARAACAPDPRARRRLALLLERERTRSGAEAERGYLEELLQDQDPRVARAAVYALGARGDRRMIGPLVEVLKDVPLFSFVRSHGRNRSDFHMESYGAVPVHRTLARLAGETPAGVSVEAYDDAFPLPYRVVEAWETWWSGRRAEGVAPVVPTIRRKE